MQVVIKIAYTVRLSNDDERETVYLIFYFDWFILILTLKKCVI